MIMKIFIRKYYTSTWFINTLMLSIGLLISTFTLQLGQNVLAQDTSAQENSLFSVPPFEISAEMPYETQFVTVNGSQMAYVEAGQGDPILFLHGNPTSKYLWRNIMPWLEDQGWVIAPDLIGMGESDKPEISYTFAEHSEYLDGFIEALELENITLVIHDWGSGLGFDYAYRNQENVKAIAFMEAVITPAMPASLETASPEMAEFLQTMRTEGVGEELVLNQNMFVEQLLPGNIIRGLTDAEMAVYRAPYPDAKSRIPTLVWPRQIPVDGEPADVTERVNAYNAWFLTSELPKLHIYVSPGAINPPEVVAFLQQQSVPNYEAVYVGRGAHFIQEDHPETIGRNIANWYSRINIARGALSAQADQPSPPVVYEGLTFPELPFTSQWVEVKPEGLPAAKLHYLEAGNLADDPILLLHGQPTWSYLWRDVIPHLESHGRVIAVDLVGFGRSDKPDIEYRYKDHIGYIEGFIEALELKDITLVIHDWGSALGFDYASRHEDNVKGIAFFEALLAPIPELPEEFREMFTAFRTPGVGEELIINQNIFVEQFVPNSIVRELSEEELNAYRAPFPTPAERLPVWRWPNEIPIAGEPADTHAVISSYAAWLFETEMPMLMLYGTPGMISNAEMANQFSESMKNLRVASVGAGLHYLQEDQPAAIGQQIVKWLDTVVR